jgi:hypothetical protein
MLLHHIRTAFRNRIEDNAYWDDTRADVLANQAMNDIAGRFGTKVQAYTEMTTIASAQRYEPPVDYIANFLLYYDSGYRQVIRILDSPDEIYGIITDPTTEGSPTHGFFWARENRPELWLYPVPDDAYTLQWFYFKIPPSLENDDDEPMISREHHQYMVDFMEFRAKIQDKEMSESEFTVLWEKKITEMRVANMKKDLVRRKQEPGMGSEMFYNVVDGDILGIREQNTGGIIW